ncbi:MAG: hypothetical protein Q9218_003963 [Villophora microphyllina]
MTHSFFACTGGFAFDLSECKEFLPAECPKRLIITARGMAVLARCGHLPNIPKADILDKCKANDLAKALVMLQASRMSLQTLDRLAFRLPVTLLEVNTNAHVLCAFFMYSLWWHKPLSPNEPIVLKGDWVGPMCAYMYLLSEASGAVDQSSLKSQTAVKTHFAFLHLYSKTPEIENLAFKNPCRSGEEVSPNRFFRAAPIANPSHHIQFPMLSYRALSSDDVGEPTLKLASRASLEELRNQRSEKAAGTAFFERRPKVNGITLDSQSDSHVTMRRLETCFIGYHAIPSASRPAYYVLTL